MFLSRVDEYEKDTGKKSIGKMTRVECKCGCVVYSIRFDHGWCRYVFKCNYCGEQRSILVDNFEDDVSVF